MYMRIDVYLCEHGYFKTRSKANLAIKAKAVYVNDKLVTKAGFLVNDGDKITISKETDRYVSRGGYKLEAAIKAFNLDFSNKNVLDIGASTGGFTDCALKHGAAFVYSVDVGSNQLDEALRCNPKVKNMEKTNILDTNITDRIDFIVMDVSFVQIKNMIPALLKYATAANQMIILIKPQFEVGKIFLKNGIVKDSKMHLRVLENVDEILRENGIYIHKCISSPILGGSGNKEFLAYCSLNTSPSLSFKELI